MLASRLVSLIAASLILTSPLFAQVQGSASLLWQDRGNPAVLDLTSGSGGKEHEPGTRFKFIKESKSGSSPKFIVEDENGVMWKAKLGEEAKPETAATRILWAAGYFVDDNYYRAQIQVQGMEHLDRGQGYVTGDIVRGVRLERDRNFDSKDWSWYENEFVGSREFNGLRVMMSLINMWDLKQVNNSTPDGQYTIADLGATFGKTGNNLTRSKGVLKDYSRSKFIEKVTPEYVDFVMHSRPFLAIAVSNNRNYRMRVRMETIAKRIPIADARWIGSVLGRLSAAQIRDAFRTAGFSPAEVEGYCETVMRRIAELQKL
jgi:hypothetical protein